MTQTDTEIINAIRIDEILIDPETGEILSEQDIGIDELSLRLKDGQEQEKSWAAHNALLKKAIGKKLDDAGVKKAETPYGVATWRTQARKSASAERLEFVMGEFGLEEREVQAIWECARDFDPKKLETLRGMFSSQLDKALDALIEEKPVSYVLLQPLRRVAPRLEHETVHPEAF